MSAKLDISPDFTVEDIHKIREYHYELTKDMTAQEKINFYNEGGRAFLKEMEESCCYSMGEERGHRWGKIRDKEYACFGHGSLFFVFRNLKVTLHFPADMGMDLETWYDGNCQMFLTVGPWAAYIPQQAEEWRKYGIRLSETKENTTGR